MIAQAAMSLDGFIADTNNQAGPLFDWYYNGDVEVSAIVRFGSGTVLIQTDRPEDLHGSHIGRGWVYVVVDDIDAHYARAKSAGASLLGEPHDYGEGYRGYSAHDLEGNLWSFGTGPVP